MKKKHKYFNQLFFTYSATFLLFLTLLFAVILGFTYREQYSKNVEVNQQLVSQIQSQLDSSLEEMDHIVNGLLFNHTFMEIMTDSTDSSATPKYDDQMVNYFLTLDAPDLSTYRIIAFNDSVYYTLTKSDENPSYIRRAITDYPWKDSILKANGERVVLSPHTDPFSENQTLVYSIARKITDGKNNCGIVEVQNEYHTLESICSLKNISGKILLFSPDGNLIYPADPTEQTLSVSDCQTIFQTIQAQKEPRGCLLENRQQISYETSEYSGWTVVLHCPVLSLVPFGMEAILFSIFLFLLLICTVLLLFRILTRRLVAPLNDLNNALKEVSLDNLALELPHKYNIEEIESINQSFLKMFDHLKHAINISIQSRANEERANYLALQSQMNPHTIYNTISMIECVAYMNGDLEASELCIRFSKMLRYISDYTKDIYCRGK